MQDRLLLQQKLVDILGSNNVYFQAPPSNKLQFPCILYELTDVNVVKANNANYSKNAKYMVTYIHLKPVMDNVFEQLLDLEYCSLNRRYISDNIYHDVFDLYF